MGIVTSRKETGLITEKGWRELQVGRININVQRARVTASIS
jgi:hypothetical protein